MTLPTNQPINGTDDDSDMFGPPRSSPPIGYHHHRSKVPMISPKLRQREERKRIIQLCAHKLERIKDSEANLRRSVCINNTYSRLNDEVRREKQNRYLANLPKPDLKPETAHDNIFSSYNSCNGGGNQNDDIINNNNNNNISTTTTTNNINNNNNHHHYLQNDTMEIYPNLSQHYHHFNHLQQHQQQPSISHSNSTTITTTTTTSLSCNLLSTGKPTIPTTTINNINQNSTNNNSNHHLHHHHQNNSITSSSCHHNHHNSTIYSSSNSINTTILSTSSSSSSSTTIPTTSSSQPTTKLTTSTTNNDNNKKEKRFRSTFNLSNNSVDTDLEILDRELSAIDASMPLIDPEITQGAEHLQIAISSRKRLRNNNNEDENDRLVREALSQFYLPTQRLISAIDDCPLDIKRTKLNNYNNNNNIINNHHHHNNIGICGNNNDLDLDLALDLNPTNHKEFEVIMDALRLGTPSPTSSCGSDSCGQAAMMSESGGGVFHNLVVTSLET